MERKLAAILAADVVGYSALMEADEAGTFDRLRAGRTELFEPEIKKHHGRIFKLMGDGLLADLAVSSTPSNVRLPSNGAWGSATRASLKTSASKSASASIWER
jgi:class 3 adenylate cyclase